MVKALGVVTVVAAALVASSNATDCVGNCLIQGESDKMTSKMAAKEAHWTAKLAKKEAGRGEGDVSLAKGASMPCVNGFAADVFPCKNVDLLSRLTEAELGSRYDGSDIWGWEDSLTGHEYAIFTFMDGTAIVDVTDPVNPIKLVRIPSQTTRVSFWRDVKVFNNTAYIVADRLAGHGLQVFDLERLRAFVDNPPASLLTVEPDFVYRTFGEAHNIIINEDTGFAYASGGDTCRGGLHVLNLNNNRLLPEFNGCWSVDGYVHDAQCVTYDGPDTRYTGREICFGYNEDTLTIVDITDKTVNRFTSELVNAEILARVSYPGVRYSHQGWITDDSRFLLLDDEKDESARTRTKTYIFNIDSLTDPRYLRTYQSPEVSIDHNLYIKGDLAYMSNYASGLRVNNLTDIYDGGSLREVAFFDTYPNGQSASFDGIWSSYVYLSSGNILLGTIEYGLFVVRVNLESEVAKEAPAPIDLDAAPTSLVAPIAAASAGVALVALAVLVVSRRKTVTQAQPAHDELEAVNPQFSAA
mmetsp:Transcript_15366/g.27319  ORF Transcript_15366/g.27319 Transcript_15366/m.27319 type:complete len:526 (+) Transcript_15366:158-1735(+)|eukprot:CAMPEP_0184544864 /NCGR_PEP_ID=MMETSP0199_2-20130426/3909_1 /TAXON_ID=1112570 /ORGANISM="Thraustochytrium sp., Strain LLF1b" /LENGTH=525 /DNA_ID=CAMNT_0026939097 /DNA_START=121 /DNA_END=1698 /DNA_ORIENTATION=+